MTHRFVFLRTLFTLTLASACSPSVGASLVACTTPAACPYGAPVCSEGFCRPCGEVVGSCGGATPFCRSAGEDAGRCAACRTHEDCGAQDGFCWYGACASPCAKHAECSTSSACVQSDDGERGGCVPASDVLPVNPSSFLDALEALRVRARERASALKDGRSALPAPLRVVRLAPSPMPYAPFRLADVRGPVYVVGADAPETTVLGGVGFADAVQVTQGVQLFLQRVRIEYVRDGIFCEDLRENTEHRARLALVEVTILRAREMALSANGCDLWMDRVAMRESNGGALALDPVARYRITNSVFADSSSSTGPLLLFDGARGVFRFNTIINNRTTSNVVVGCGQVPSDLGASLILRSQDPARDPAVDPLAGYCQGQDLVLDRATAASGALVGAPALVDSGLFGDYHPKASPETSACCVRAVAPLPAGGDYRDPLHDFDGRPRRRSPWTLGAYEVIP